MGEDRKRNCAEGRSAASPPGGFGHEFACYFRVRFSYRTVQTFDLEVLWHAESPCSVRMIVNYR